MNLYILAMGIINILSAILIYIKFKSILNVFNIFNSLWFIIVNLSYTGLYGLYIPKVEVYFIILIGHISINMGYIYMILICKVKMKKMSFKKFNIMKCKKIITKLQIVISIILIPYFINGINIINSKGMGLLRAEKVEGFVQQLTLFYIAEPILYFSIILAIIIILETKSLFKELLFLILNIIMHVIAFGGRFIIFRFIIYFIVIILVIDRKKHNLKKVSRNKKYTIYIFFFILVSIIYKVTIERQGADGSVFRAMFIYFVGGIGVLNYLYVNNLIFTFDFMLGKATLGGLIDTAILGIIMITGQGIYTTHDQAIYIINSVTSQNMAVGIDIEMNAFTTMYYIFLRDGGFIGLILISFIVGFFMMYLQIKTCMTSKIIYIFIYVIFATTILEGIFRWNFLASQNWMIIFYVILFEKYLK